MTSQAERTRQTKQRLIEATLDTLVESGWSGLTTTEVSRRAGVSRGAQVHHFPSKNDMVVAAVEHLADRQRELLGATEVGCHGRTTATLEAFVDYFTSRDFSAAVKLWVSALGDSAVRERVLEVQNQMGKETHRLAVDMLGIDESKGRNRQLVQGMLDLARGLGLAALLSDDSPRRSSIVETWAAVLDAELER